MKKIKKEIKEKIVEINYWVRDMVKNPKKLTLSLCFIVIVFIVFVNIFSNILDNDEKYDSNKSTRFYIKNAISGEHGFKLDYSFNPGLSDLSCGTIGNRSFDGIYNKIFANDDSSGFIVYCTKSNSKEAYLDAYIIIDEFRGPIEPVGLQKVLLTTSEMSAFEKEVPVDVKTEQVNNEDYIIKIFPYYQKDLLNGTLLNGKIMIGDRFNFNKRGVSYVGLYGATPEFYLKTVNKKKKDELNKQFFEKHIVNVNEDVYIPIDGVGDVGDFFIYENRLINKPEAEGKYKYVFVTANQVEEVPDEAVKFTRATKALLTGIPYERQNTNIFGSDERD